MGWRFLAQQVPGGPFVHTNLPITGARITRTLSGPGRLTGTLHVDESCYASGQLVLRPWGTTVWAERDGVIIGGGILTPWSPSDHTLEIDCMGLSGYPRGMPWTAAQRLFVRTDPLDIVRVIWAQIQAHAGGNLGVIVDGTTSTTRVGDPPGTEDGEPFALEWWSTHDLGDVIDTLAAATPFDYLEHTAWNAAGTALVHRLRLGAPALGTRRTGPAAPRFVVGENVTAWPDMDAEDDDYATEVLALGAGEGRGMIRQQLYKDAPTGLRRVHTLIDKEARTPAALANAARRSLAWLTGEARVRSFTVADHPNAPLGSFDVGDEVRVVGSSDAATDLDRWVRIIELDIDTDRADEQTVIVQEV